jgi:protein-disulfide isomerase
VIHYTLDQPPLSVPVSERDHIRGPAVGVAAATLVEYGDYECPFCRAASLSVKHLLQLVDDLAFVYRHFPLSQIHPHAFQAAEAAEAAGAQGRFWEMHDLLFANQERLEFGDLLGYARMLDLDLERFASELATHAHEGRIREDVMSGIRSGVNGTPTFFVNGVRHNGGYDVPSLLNGLNAAVAV